MDRLDEGIRINKLSKVIESIQMHTVKAPGECPSDTKYSGEAKEGLLEKVKLEPSTAIKQ